LLNECTSFFRSISIHSERIDGSPVDARKFLSIGVHRAGPLEYA
jgi:hypothetical protein